MMESLTGDLQSEILVRLPAKTLARLRCVSKLWNVVTCKPSFIKSHLNRSLNENTDDRILVIYTHHISKKTCFAVRSTKSPDHLELIDFEKPPSFNFNFNLPDHHHHRLIGACNGLICLSTWPSPAPIVIQIWNPSLMALRTLPPPFLIPDKSSSQEEEAMHHVSLGFGFDAANDDYKVVKITARVGRNELMQVFEPKEWLPVEVFSMKTNCWKLIPESSVPSSLIFIKGREAVLLDGSLLHWIGIIGDCEIILLFDLGTGTFSEISLPDAMEGRMTRLGSIAGKLALFSYTGFEYCEVWVMEEYPIVQSWTKQHVVSQQFRNRIDRPWGFTRDGECVFSTRDGHLVLYDPNNTSSVKTFGICMWKYSCTVVPHVDSLVPVAPAPAPIVANWGEQFAGEVEISNWVSTGDVRVNPRLCYCGEWARFERMPSTQNGNSKRLYVCCEMDRCMFVDWAELHFEGEPTSVAHLEASVTEGLAVHIVRALLRHLVELSDVSPFREKWLRYVCFVMVVYALFIM